MSFGQKIKSLRSEKGWSQSELAKKLSIQREQVSNYERSQCLPNSEVLMKLAQAFEVSSDYLLFDEQSERSSLQIGIKDIDLLQQFKELDKANEIDRKLVKDLVATVLWKNRLQKMVNEV